jgi:predicted DNA-binding ribbon-helix-helix protein
MCEVYVKADPILYESRTRSVRLHGVLTTIRLENIFWDVLGEIAARESKTTNQMIDTLHNELFALRGDSPNFTSFLRVCCLRHLRDVRQSAVEPALIATRPQPLQSVKRQIAH